MLHGIMRFRCFCRVPSLQTMDFVCRNLAENAFTGGIPYSISQMTDLKYL